MTTQGYGPLLEGARGVIDEQGWREISQQAIYEGIDAVGPAAQHMLAVSLGPRIRQPHEMFANLALADISTETLAPGTIRVTYHYVRGAASEETPQESDTVIEVSTDLAQAEVTRDIEDKPLEVTYVDGQGRRHVQRGSASILLPQTSLVISRTEPQSPGNKGRLYSGKVNSSAWRIDPATGPEEWLCSGINGSSNNGGRSYRVVYRFQHRKSWKAYLEYRDVDGNVPPDVGKLFHGGTGLFTVYASIDFNALNLP